MKNKNAGNPYDVVATTGSQVYGGYESEYAPTNQAVEATRGQVMVHGGRPIIACFHSNSGGYTEDSSNVWRAAFPYLKAKPDRFSLGVSGSYWQYFISYQDVANRLRKKGFPVARVKQVRVRGKSRSGRNIKVEVVSEKGITTFSSNQFRLAVGESKLKSTLFDTTPVRAGILFKGRGYGHGVGMSQWGANKMAQLGSTYQEILHYYYRDIEIVTIKG
jgi:stage II sporulation protein D